MTKLSINVNKVATLRNTRHIGIPSLIHASRLCLEAGADGITVHPRPDERHIRPYDVNDIAMLVKEYPDVEYNIEGNPFHGVLQHVENVQPTQCTLVPDDPDVFTSDHGWDLRKDGERLKPVIEKLHRYNCRVSLFMDPVPEDMELVVETGADRIELYTEPYAAAYTEGTHGRVVREFAEAARRAAELGIGVNAGHDLNLDNLGYFLKTVPNVAEVSIGHALIADALEWGLSVTVQKYLEVIDECSRG